MFWALFRTPTTLQPLPPIRLYIRGSLEYNISFQKTLPWQLLSLYVSSPCSSYIHYYKRYLVKFFLKWNIFIGCRPYEKFSTRKFFKTKYFCRTSTLRNTKIFPTKISYRPYPQNLFVSRHSLRMAKAHECPLAAVYTTVSGGIKGSCAWFFWFSEAPNLMRLQEKATKRQKW